ncbi:hypothetical protein N0V88_003434 [Collariella sp. IMI 366227]|nr:hypothetical protein N0V88_003434 [Collariella sp. IMI 366227]
MLSHDANIFTNIICSVCLNSSCTMRCMETHMNYYACHNSNCRLHLEPCDIDGEKGIIYAGNAPSKAKRGTKDRDRHRNRSRTLDAQRPRKLFRHCSERKHDRPPHRREPSPRWDEPFRGGARGTDRRKNNPFRDDFFNQDQRDTGWGRNDPFDDAFFRDGARDSGWDWNHPFGMGSFQSNLDDMDREMKEMKERVRSRFNKPGIRMPGGAGRSPFGGAPAPDGRRKFEGFRPDSFAGGARGGASHADTRNPYDNADQHGTRHSYDNAGQADARNPYGNAGQRTAQPEPNPKPAEPFRYEYVGTEDPDGEIIDGFEGRKKEENRGC